MTNSKSDNFLQNRQGPPIVSPTMARSVSNTRRSMLEEEFEAGFYRESATSSGRLHKTADYGPSPAGFVVSSGQNKQLKKLAVSSGVQDAGGFRGSGGTVRQSPDMYSPLWLNSNLNLPRDRATINAWSRAYFALNGFVQSAISLHSTYPISKLTIKCKNPEVEKFFSEMIEEIDLMNICVQIAQEFWILGEAFVYAELDEERRRWSRLIIQNPDYINVERSVASDEPIISLRPDAALKRICTSNKPIDVQQRQKLDAAIVEHVRRGENIPLNNFYVSHLARKINPYDVRGTGLIVSSFRALMLFDKLKECKYAQADNMVNPITLVKIGNQDYKAGPADLEAWRQVFEECHDEETEVLTAEGFKKFNEVMDFDSNDKNHIVKVSPKENVKIACFNAQNEQLEYHTPINASLYNHDGDMYHFANNKIDIKVTPNHKMWVSKREYIYNGHRNLRKTRWGDWNKIEAKDLNFKDYQKFRSKISWVGNDDIKTVDVCGKQVPVELYLEYLGYVISEGCLYTNNKGQYTVGICQSTNKYHQKMSDCLSKFAKCIDKSYSEQINKLSEKYENYTDSWSGIISGKEIYEHFKEEIQGINDGIKSFDKKVPRWIMELSPRLLKIFLQALVDGDGSFKKNQDQSDAFVYYTTSKQLSDDVYEMAYKCGFVPTSFIKNDVRGNRLPVYTTLWSTSDRGDFPLVYKTSRNSATKEKHDLIKIEKYQGKVWCFEVPTGLFITRRNGKITVQGNSQSDKDFKIFTHDAVAVERVGANSAVMDINPDIVALLKEILTGLMVPSVLMDGGADTTYANGSVALDVLRQRYMQFRNMLTIWLRKKIFAPISKINDFYEYVDKKKVLIVPDIDWNHMSLFDANDYIQTITALATAQEKRASYQTLYRSLGLVWQEEKAKIREEDIFTVIREKETAAMKAMTLDQLRSLGPNDPVQEPIQSPLPGEQLPGVQNGGAEGAPSGMPGMPDMGAPPGGSGAPPS